MSILLFVAPWVAISLFGLYVGVDAFDHTPFHLLSGIIALGALVLRAALDEQREITQLLSRTDGEINENTKDRIVKI